MHYTWVALAVRMHATRVPRLAGVSGWAGGVASLHNNTKAVWILTARPLCTSECKRAQTHHLCAALAISCSTSCMPVYRARRPPGELAMSPPFQSGDHLKSSFGSCSVIVTILVALWRSYATIELPASFHAGCGCPPGLPAESQTATAWENSAI